MKKTVAILIMLVLCFALGITALADETAVAEVNGTKYTDLQDAIDAANSGDTVTLLCNVSYSDSIIIAKSLNLDLGQFYIRSEATSIPFENNSYGYNYYPAALYVRNPELGTINVVITASTGGIIAEGGSRVAIMSGNISDDGDNKMTNLTINGGNYTGDRYCIFHNNGLLTINSGTYQDAYTGTEPQHLLYSYRYNYFFGDFAINGGSFKNFNPACAYMHGGEYSATYGSAKHWHGYVPEGKTGVLGDNGWYTVADGSRVVERTYTGDRTSSSFVCHCYASLQDAITAGEANVTLLKNVAEDFIIEGYDEKDFILNLDRHTFNGTITVHHNIKSLTVKGAREGSSILLAEPLAGHGVFEVWCSGSNETRVPATKSGDKWVAVTGTTYHTHFHDGKYEHAEEHFDFGTAVFGYNVADIEAKSTVFNLSESADTQYDMGIVGFEENDYFTASIDPENRHRAIIKPKEGLDVGIYDERIYVTLQYGEERSSHQIFVKFAVEEKTVTAAYISETIKVGETPKLEIKVDDIVNSFDASSYESPIVEDVPTEEGVYELTPTGGKLPKNYKFEYVSGTLTIEEKTEPEVKPEACDHMLDENGKCSRCGVIIISYTDGRAEASEDEINPGTGAPVISGTVTVAMFAAVACVLKKK